jgi:hypothetical protein
MIVGFFFIRVIPLPKSDRTRGLDHRVEDSSAEADVSAVSAVSAAFMNEDNSQMPLLPHADLEEEHPISSFIHQQDEHSTGVSRDRHSLELSPERTHSPSTSTFRRSQSTNGRLGVGAETTKLLDHLPNLHGKALWQSGDFWLMCAILSLCASLPPLSPLMKLKSISKRNWVDVFVCFYNQQPFH